MLTSPEHHEDVQKPKESGRHTGRRRFIAQAIACLLAACTIEETKKPRKIIECDPALRDSIDGALDVCIAQARSEMLGKVSSFEGAVSTIQSVSATVRDFISVSLSPPPQPVTAGGETSTATPAESVAETIRSSLTLEDVLSFSRTSPEVADAMEELATIAVRHPDTMEYMRRSAEQKIQLDVLGSAASNFVLPNEEELQRNRAHYLGLSQAYVNHRIVERSQLAMRP